MAFDPSTSLKTLADAAGMTVSEMLAAMPDGLPAGYALEILALLNAAAGGPGTTEAAQAALEAMHAGGLAGAAGAMVAAGVGQSPAEIQAAKDAINAGADPTGNSPVFPPPPPPPADGTPPAGSTPPGDNTPALTGLMNQAGAALGKIIRFLDSPFVFIYDALVTVGNALLAGIQKNIVAPGFQIVKNASDGLTRAMFGQDTLTNAANAPPRFPAMPGDFTTETAKSFSAALVDMINEPKTVMDKFTGLWLKVSIVLASLQAGLRGVIDDIEHEAQSGNPKVPLSVQTAVDLMNREIWQEPRARAEAGLNGINADRFTALKDLTSYLPPPAEVASWVAKGLIDPADLNRVLRISGYSAAFAEAFVRAVSRDPEPVSNMAASGKMDAGASGWLASALNGEPPADIAALYKRALIDEKQAKIDWVNHFNVPGVSAMFAGYFRNIFSKEDLINAAKAENLPLEILDQMIEAARPTISPRVVATLLSREVLDEGSAVQLFQELGYRMADIDLLLRYVKPAPQKKPPTTAGEMSKLGMGSAASLYTDGAISKDAYTNILTQHGLEPAAAALQVQAVDLHNTVAQRKAAAMAVVDLVSLGYESIDAGVKDLTDSGYSSTEILRYQKLMHHTKTTTQKDLTFAQAVKALNGGFIDVDGFIAYLGRNNYRADVIPIILQLEGYTNAGPITAS